MLYIKACRRCGGDVELATDMYGQYLACLQCGHVIETKDEALAALQTAGKKAA